MYIYRELYQKAAEETPKRMLTYADGCGRMRTYAGGGGDSEKPRCY